MIRKYLTVLPALALLAPAAAVAEQKAEKIAITPDSKTAAIVFKSPDLPVPPMHRTAYRLAIMPYDAETGHMKGGLMGGGEVIAARPKLSYDGYVISDIKPGTYVFGSLSRQDFWALCFNGDSRQFTIKPGEVLYLGDFDAAKHVVELERLAITTGQISTRGEPVHFFDTVSPPAFAPAGEVELSAVAEALKRHAPKTTVAPKAADLAPARFGTGSDMFGLKRICGGYYRKNAK